MLDVFSNAAFHVWSLTSVLNQVPYTPGLIGRLGLFSPRNLATTMTMIEVRGDRLALVPERPRGAPPTPDVVDSRALIPVGIPHFPIRTSIFADSVQNVRAFGTDNQLEAVQTVVDEREAQLGRRLDVTQEYLRLGAVKGVVVTEADRESGVPMTQYSLFDMFHVPPNAVINWPIIGAGGATPPEQSFWLGQLTGLVNSLTRAVANNINGGMYTALYGIAGSTAFDAFAMHPELRTPFLGVNPQPLLRNALGTTLSFKDITIEEYRGKIGNIELVKPDEIHFFPVGVPDLFIECYAPADYWEAVNSIALPRYSKMWPMDFDKGVDLEAQMNVLPLCTAPRTLFTVKVVPYVAP
jgi:Phage major capsid protein E